ncbi:hypothetical protein [Aeromicrobium alkaliterrae]|uniref:Mce-associated membrane protein n=1 Tax=Aeromicrobium alkaliterrae TaxID=302168 RepID=A0ABN2KDD8_9ACTN
MNAQQPPRRRRIAGESKPGQDAAAPQARRPTPPRTPSRPVVPTPQPAPTKREREETEKKAAVATPVVRRPVSRPSRRVASEEPTPVAVSRTKPERTTDDAGPSRTGVRRLLPVLVVLVGVAAAIAGFLQMQREAPLTLADARAAADAAGNGVVAIMGYDYRDLDTYESEARAAMTDGYASSEFDDIIDTLRSEAEAGQAQVEVTVHAAATETCRGECPAGEASVLVVVDKITLTTNLQAPSVTSQRLRVEMVQDEDDDWLVDSITYLGA